MTSLVARLFIHKAAFWEGRVRLPACAALQPYTYLLAWRSSGSPSHPADASTQLSAGSFTDLCLCKLFNNLRGRLQSSLIACLRIFVAAWQPPMAGGACGLGVLLVRILNRRFRYPYAKIRQAC